MTIANIIKVWEDREKYYASILVNDKENVEHIVELDKKIFDDTISNENIKDYFVKEISNKVILEKEKEVEKIPVPKDNNIDFSQIIGEIVLNDEFLAEVALNINDFVNVIKK